LVVVLDHRSKTGPHGEREEGCHVVSCSCVQLVSAGRTVGKLWAD
jgi:hypothetical protein